MKRMAPGFLILYFLTFAKAGISQPWGGGGIQIMKIYDAGKNLVIKHDPSLKIRYFILGIKPLHKAIKEFFDKDLDIDYDFADEISTRLYLPPYIKKHSKKIALPNQRLQLIRNKDTMTIDFIGVMPDNAAAYTDKMEKIEFKPGHFTCYRNPRKSAPAYWDKLDAAKKDEITRLLEQGIDDSAIYKLGRYGLLHYNPPPAVVQNENNDQYSIRCIDTSYGKGYYYLCHEMINEKESLIEIQTKAIPVMRNSFPCYHFFYNYHCLAYLSPHKTTDEDKRAAAKLIRLRTILLFVNHTVFSGRLEIAFPFSVYRPGNIISDGYAFRILDFREGKCIKESFIPDEDLLNYPRHVELNSLKFQ